ncbi:MAG: response regulator [Candidatus Gygaella obscura]|nr:response regulator [Candidatus Gygaella obscura]
MTKERILFILRDDEFLKDVIVSLDRTKYNIEVETSSVRGLENIVSDQPFILFLDIAMRDIVSHQVCRYLRYIHKTKHLPIVLLVDDKTPKQNLFWAMELGASDYLTEPIEELVINEKIKKFA